LRKMYVARRKVKEERERSTDRESGGEEVTGIARRVDEVVVRIEMV